MATDFQAVTGFDFFPVVVDSVEEELERAISGEHWGFEVREVPGNTSDPLYVAHVTMPEDMGKPLS